MDKNMIMTWDEMTHKYPSMWVVIREAVMDGPDVISGDVIAAISDDDICEYEDKHFKDGYLFRRTADGDWNGTFRADFDIQTI